MPVFEPVIEERQALGNALETLQPRPFDPGVNLQGLDPTTIMQMSQLQAQIPGRRENVEALLGLYGREVPLAEQRRQFEALAPMRAAQARTATTQADIAEMEKGLLSEMSPTQRQAYVDALTRYPRTEYARIAESKAAREEREDRLQAAMAVQDWQFRMGQQQRAQEFGTREKRLREQMMFDALASTQAQELQRQRFDLRLDKLGRGVATEKTSDMLRRIEKASDAALILERGYVKDARGKPVDLSPVELSIMTERHNALAPVGSKKGYLMNPQKPGERLRLKLSGTIEGRSVNMGYVQEKARTSGWRIEHILMQLIQNGFAEVSESGK